MKISYITTFDALNIHNWSGLGYSISKMLENQGTEIDYIGNLHTSLSSILKLKQMVYSSLMGKKFNANREPLIARKLAKQIKTKLSSDTDIIFSLSTIPVSLLQTHKPKVIYTDATFAGMLNFYDNFSNLCKETIKHGNYIEQKALESSSLIIYSSDWAAKTAIDYYNINPDKIKVVPFGANIETKIKPDDINNIIKARSSSTLNLLFIGVDWIRKGGDLAVRIANELNNIGIKTILHIVGIRKLPSTNMPNFILNHGYISKSTEEGKKRINELLATSHFLLVPSIAEAYGLVFCEANSFGLPSISTNVGGITTIIKDDINGKTFSLDADVSEWSKYIAKVFTDTPRYNELCLSSFREFELRLNWDVAGRTIMNLIKEI